MEQLQELAWALAKMVIERFREGLKREEWARVYRVPWLSEDGTSWGMEAVQVPRIDTPMSDELSAIKDSEEYRNYRAELASHVSTGTDLFDYPTFLNTMALYLQDVPDVDSPEEEVFKRLFLHSFNKHHARETCHEVVVPLIGTTCNASFDLGDGVELVPLSLDLKHYLMGMNTSSEVIDSMRLSNSCIRFTFRGNPRNPRVPDHILDQTRRILYALRLSTDADFGAYCIHQYPSDLPLERIEKAREAVIREMVPRRIENHLTTFNTRDVVEFDAKFAQESRKALDALRKRPDLGGSALGVALARFCMARGRERLDDVVLDLAIALEASVLHDGRGGGFKLTGRAGVLMSQAGHDPSDAMCLRRLHNTRHAIVHGSAPDESRTKEAARMKPEWFKTTRVVIRRICERIALGESHQELCKSLDGELLAMIQESGAE